jgi:predicted AAA+ superfamily ATPase
VWPFSLAEVAATATEPGLSPTLPAAFTRREAERTAARMAVLGGFPEVWLSEDPERVLRAHVEAFVIRDASDQHRIEHVDAFRRLLLLVAGHAGQLANTSEWASVCGIARGTVERYLDVLEDQHVAARVHPWSGGKRSELARRPKVYFVDPGVRNRLVEDLRPFDVRSDRGQVLETWVFSELRKHLSPLLPGDALRYWRSRSGAEVDFVVDRPGDPLAFEVKAEPMRRPALSRSSRSFIEAYAPSSFFVVNTALEAVRPEGRTTVRWITPAHLADPAGLGLV